MSPTQTDKDREEATRRFVQVALDDGWALREEYQAFLERRRANRDQLRSLAAQGKLSDEQIGELEELYSKRQEAAEPVAQAAA